MVSRFLLYITRFTLIISVLLILIGIRYTDNVNYRPTPKSQKSIENYLKPGDTDDYVAEPVRHEHESLNIEEILMKTRTQISTQLQNYNFTLSGVKKLEDLLMEYKGNPLRSIILSTWRSGTTFLGELLNAVQGTFYHYEPLLRHKTNVIRGPPLAVHALYSVKKMFKCDFIGIKQYFNYGKMHLNQFSHNSRLWKYCKYQKEFCLDANFTSKFCKLFPFQSMKLVRVRLHLIEDILRDEELNVRVVLLIRDPRGVMQSRQFQHWCKPSPDCWNPKRLCGDMVSDHNEIGILLKKYPKQLAVLRFEELALFPEVTMLQVFEFLRLSPVASVWKFLYRHTNIDIDSVSSTYRVSRDVPFRWKNVLEFDYVKEIQGVCKEAMEMWGYRLAHNVSHLRSEDFYPLGSWRVRM